jgi:integrase
MSLYKRGNVWWMRFTTPDRRELRETTGTADKRAAQELHDTRKAELWRQSRLGERPRYTWQQAVVRWLEETPGRKSMSTTLSHLRFADSALGGLRLDDITADRIAGVVRAYRATGVKSSSANRLSILVRSILNAAYRWGWTPAKAPPVLRMYEAQRRVRWLTREEADRLIAALPPHLAAMARFTLATGLRDQNVCKLGWAQVDLDRRVAWIHPDESKGKRAIAVPLNADAVVVLREQQGQHDQWVFPYRGRPLHRCGHTGFKAALKTARISNFRWHDLRHTWASWHVQAGTPLNVLKELGGWASLEMVLRYAHLSADHLAEHAERISGPRLVRTINSTSRQNKDATG